MRGYHVYREIWEAACAEVLTQGSAYTGRWWYLATSSLTKRPPLFSRDQCLCCTLNLIGWLVGCPDQYYLLSTDQYKICRLDSSHNSHYQSTLSHYYDRCHDTCSFAVHYLEIILWSRVLTNPTPRGVPSAATPFYHHSDFSGQIPVNCLSPT